MDTVASREIRKENRTFLSSPREATTAAGTQPFAV